jgi:hypothetical protein
MDERVVVTAITGGYNNNYVASLVSETYPRFKNRYIKFVTEDSDVRMYFDYPFDPNDPVLKPAKCSIAVVEEPYCIVPDFSHFISHHGHMFDGVFTNHTELLYLNRPNVHYLPGSGASVNEWGIFPKSEMVCAIFSQKNFAMGHKLRQQIRNDPFFQSHPALRFVNSVPYVEDKYIDKSSLIRPYRFSIGIESVYETMIGDKILDSFLTGTIPIYKGSSRVRDYFDMRGVITFDTVDELKGILNSLAIYGEKVYEDALPAIRTNYARAVHWTDMSYMLWTHGLEDIFKQKGII